MMPHDTRGFDIRDGDMKAFKTTEQRLAALERDVRLIHDLDGVLFAAHQQRLNALEAEVAALRREGKRRD